MTIKEQIEELESWLRYAHEQHFLRLREANDIFLAIEKETNNLNKLYEKEQELDDDV